MSAPLVKAFRDEASIQVRGLRADADLRRLASSRGQIVVGPWLSEVGFEVLYWLPLLRWLAERHDWDPSRVTAITRGGAGAWYEGLAGERIEAFDVLAPEELAAHQAAKRDATDSQKQLTVDALDRRLLERVQGPHTLIHPRLMYRLFAPFWAGRRPMSFVVRHTSFGLLTPPPAPPELARAVAELPRPYVAVKAYFSDCFPDTPANRTWLQAFLEAVARHTHVVLLSTPFEVDDHRDFSGEGTWSDLGQLLRPQTNLAAQTAVIEGAAALLTTYGGFSYLGPFLGVPTYAFHSHENFVAAHLDVMARAARGLAGGQAAGRFTSFSVGQAAALAELVAQGSPA